MKSNVPIRLYQAFAVAVCAALFCLPQASSRLAAQTVDAAMCERLVQDVLKEFSLKSFGALVKAGELARREKDLRACLDSPINKYGRGVLSSYLDERDGLEKLFEEAFPTHPDSAYFLYGLMLLKKCEVTLDQLVGRLEKGAAAGGLLSRQRLAEMLVNGSRHCGERLKPDRARAKEMFSDLAVKHHVARAAYYVWHTHYTERQDFVALPGRPKLPVRHYLQIASDAGVPEANLLLGIRMLEEMAPIRGRKTIIKPDKVRAALDLIEKAAAAGSFVAAMEHSSNSTYLRVGDRLRLFSDNEEQVRRYFCVKPEVGAKEYRLTYASELNCSP